MGVAGFIIAVGIVSTVTFMLSLRADRISDRRRAYSSTGDAGGISSGNDGFSLFNWFYARSASSSSDVSCTSSSSSFFGGSDSGCSDTGGGGDSGGGGGD